MGLVIKHVFTPVDLCIDLVGKTGYFCLTGISFFLIIVFLQVTESWASFRPRYALEIGKRRFPSDNSSNVFYPHAPTKLNNTVEFRFYEPPRETKIGSRSRGVKLQCLTEKGKRLLVRVIGRFEKLRVREIGIHCTIITDHFAFVF